MKSNNTPMPLKMGLTLCTSVMRCNNHKACSICSTNRRKKEYSIINKNITEKHLQYYTHKYYLVITSKDLDIGLKEKLSNVDLFIKEFLKSKRNKNFFISKDTQYYITKEISYSKFGYNPHYNIVLLSVTPLDFKNKQLESLLERYSVKLHNEKTYKINGQFKTSLLTLDRVNKSKSSKLYLSKFQNLR